MSFDIQRIGFRIGQIAFRGFRLLDRIFAVRNFCKAQLALCIGISYSEYFLIAVVEREPCTLDRLIILSVLLDKLNSTFDLRFDEIAFGSVGKLERLSVFLDAERVFSCVDVISFGSFCFLDDIIAVRKFCS